jgi:hypothetical protein
MRLYLLRRSKIVRGGADIDVYVCATQADW